MEKNDNNKITMKRIVLNSAKPLIFRKKKIARIGELANEGKGLRKDQNDNDKNKFNDEYDDLSLDFFERYLSLFKSKKTDALQTETSDALNQLSQKRTSINYRSKTEKILTNKINTIRSILLEDIQVNERKSTKVSNLGSQGEKRKLQYQTYISSIIITQCQVETVKNIHNDISLILNEVPKEPNCLKGVELLNLIQWIDLSENKIKAIHEDIAMIPNLKILNLHNNLIDDLNKITAIGKIKNLINLTLFGNQVCYTRGYRQFVIEMCPVLEILDSAGVTEKELEIIHFGGSKFGEKREDGNGKVLKYPKSRKKFGDKYIKNDKDK